MVLMEDIWISKSNMKCIMIAEEDECRMTPGTDESIVQYNQRAYRIFFEALDELGIRRVKTGVLCEVMGTGYEGEYLELISTDDDALREGYCTIIDEYCRYHPDEVEYGRPEPEITCDESCRGKIKVTHIRSQLGVPTFSVEYVKQCIYRDML